MRTLTSLDAQNHFGELIDTSQREPVLTLVEAVLFQLFYQLLATQQQHCFK
ncbi:hypothetical protein [Methylomonas sp. MgM2]